MFALIAAAAAASSMTPTLEITPRTIRRDGVKATYTRSVDAEGTIHLRGSYDSPDQASFHYVVRGDKVSGKVDGVETSFKRPRAR